MRLRSLLCITTITFAAAAASACDDSSSSGTSTGFDAGNSGGFDAATAETDSSVTADSASPDAPTDAAVIVTSTPFATGLDDAGNALADKSIDPHWTVKDGAGTALTSYVQSDALGYEGYWLPPSATSKFISPFIDTVDPSGNGTFTYSTSFAIGPEVDVTTAALVVRYASDNETTAISFNGVALADVEASSYSAFTMRTLRTLTQGTNTISFTVVNSSGGPTGLRVELALPKP